MWRTLCRAISIRVPVPTSSPVFRLREKRGKLELVTSRRSRCPRQVRARVRVEPAALLEDRHADGLGTVPELLPVAVVRLVLPPLAPVVDPAPDHHLVEVDQRQVAQDPLVQEQVGRARPGDERHRAVPERRRAERQDELEGAAGEVAVPEVVVVDDVRGEAAEVRMPDMGELPLHDAAVAPPPRPDAPVAPALAGRPGQRVLRVDAVEHPGHELPVRLVAAAHVDDDRRVPALGEEDAPGDEPLAGRLVRRPLDDRRKGAVGKGQVDVGGEGDPVARRHAAVVEQARVVAGGRARPGACLRQAPRKERARSGCRRSGRRRGDGRPGPRAAARPRRRSPARSGSACGSGSRSGGRSGSARPRSG